MKLEKVYLKALKVFAVVLLGIVLVQLVFVGINLISNFLNVSHNFGF